MDSTPTYGPLRECVAQFRRTVGGVPARNPSGAKRLLLCQCTSSVWRSFATSIPTQVQTDLGHETVTDVGGRAGAANRRKVFELPGVLRDESTRRVSEGLWGRVQVVRSPGPLSMKDRVYLDEEVWSLRFPSLVL